MCNNILWRLPPVRLYSTYKPLKPATPKPTHLYRKRNRTHHPSHPNPISLPHTRASCKSSILPQPGIPASRLSPYKKDKILRGYHRRYYDRDGRAGARIGLLIGFAVIWHFPYLSPIWQRPFAVIYGSDRYRRTDGPLRCNLKAEAAAGAGRKRRERNVSEELAIWQLMQNIC